MPLSITLTDFILHLGRNGASDSCALLRTPGDVWIEPGHVLATATGEDSYDLSLVTPTQRICLSGVARRHIDHIRGQGLYVIQRRGPETESEAVLLEWREC